MAAGVGDLETRVGEGGPDRATLTVGSGIQRHKWKLSGVEGECSATSAAARGTSWAELRIHKDAALPMREAEEAGSTHVQLHTQLHSFGHRLNHLTARHISDTQNDIQ